MKDLVGMQQEDSTLATLPAVAARLAALSNTRDRLRRRLGEADDTMAAEYAVELRRIVGDMEAAEAEHQQQMQLQASWQNAEQQRQGVLDYAAALQGHLGNLTWEAKRQLLARLGAQVRLYRTDHALRWELRTYWGGNDLPWSGTIFLDDGFSFDFTGPHSDPIASGSVLINHRESAQSTKVFNAC